MTTSELISIYTAQYGWTFKQVSWPRAASRDLGKSAVGDEGHGVEVAWQYSSPAMKDTVGLLPDGFDADTMLRDESEHRVRRDHAAAIYRAVQDVTNGVVRELGVLYRLRDRGKVVEIPAAIKVSDFVVRLTP